VVGTDPGTGRAIDPGTARAVRRNTWRLIAAHGVSQVGFSVLLIVGVPAAASITGADWASGLVWAASFAAGAIGAALVGRWMDRVGRRPGLAGGYAAMAVGAIGAAAAIAAGSYPGLLMSTLVFGAGSGASNLARGAVADMYEPARRGRAVGILIGAGVVGAIGGPLLISVVQHAAEARGGDPSVVPWVISILGAVTALAVVATLRPDPRDLAHREEDLGGPPAAVRSRRELLRVPAFRATLAAVAASQMAMVGVMGVTPNALEHLGHGGATSWVISGHIAGMYAFAPAVGWFLDRAGRRPGMLLGLGLTGAGALIAAAQGSTPGIGGGLFLIGLGWSATYLAVTAVISDVTHADERSGALGFADVVVLVCSATAAVIGGVILDAAGYAAVGVGAAVLVAMVGVSVAEVALPRTSKA
jgi:MFS family permease